MSADIHQILKQIWGYDSFREMQEEIIASALEGKDTLALLPTGGGKSICFQVPALAKEGICIVISPLIALMKDQVNNLKKKGIKAEAIVSGMSKREVDITLDNCIYGDFKFLYVSPERLKSDLFIERLKKMNVNLFAIDEAHCISQWGYDFRPPYLEIANLREHKPDVPFLALTATATPNVVKDIQAKLEFKKENVFQKSFERKNLHYVVLNEEDKMGRMMKVLEKVPGSGIIYVRNRRKTQEIAHYLNNRGIASSFYHAGLEPEERAKRQENWINNQFRIMVATNAFGMGIDKPDVRVVINLDLPDSLEAYFQEAGRGGRDEKRAFSVLLVNENDREELTERVEKSYPEKNKIQKAYQAVYNELRIALGAGEDTSHHLEPEQIKNRYDLTLPELYHSIKFLERAGYFNLSEAYYTSSKVKIELSNLELYDFQVRNPKFDPYIKLLLRSYGGLFDSFAKINEKDLAKRSGQPIAVFKQVLNKLNELEVITYEEQSNAPLLTLLQPRIDIKNLRIDKEVYENRKKEAKERLDAVIQYAFTDHLCRSKMLLNYFGESDAKDCGQCDVCLERKKEPQNRKEQQQLQEHILKELKKEALDANSLTQKLNKQFEEKDILEVVQWLLDQGMVKLNDKNELHLS